MDALAIADAIAAKYAPGVLTTPADAYNPIRRCYAQMPNNIPEVPAVVVFPMHGKIIEGAQTWDVRSSFEVRAYFGLVTGDTTIAETDRQAWLGTLLGASNSNMTLGVTNLKSAMPIEWRFDDLDYAGQTYLGIVIDYEVIVREPVAFAP